MKRILGVSLTLTAISIASIALAGLIPDDGAGIKTASPKPAIIDVTEQLPSEESDVAVSAEVTVVEEKGGPEVTVPAATAEPEAEVADSAKDAQGEAPADEEADVVATAAADAPEEPAAEVDADAVKPDVTEAASETPEEADTAAVKTAAVEEQADTVEPEAAETAEAQDDAEAPAETLTESEIARIEETDAQERGERAFFVAAGRSRASVKAIALGLEFFSTKTWFDEGNWYCTPFLEILAAYWEGDPGHTGITSLHEGGVSGYVRCIHRKVPDGVARPYVDLGLGIHYTTEDRIEGKELGRQWLAGSNIGVGLVLGESERFDVGLRVRHLSNGGTRDINWGINHYMVRAAVRF